MLFTVKAKKREETPERNPVRICFNDQVHQTKNGFAFITAFQDAQLFRKRK